MGAAQPIRLLLAEDHVLVREGMRLLVGMTEDIRIVAETGVGAEVAQLAGQVVPDVALVDLVLPDCDGASLVEPIRDAAPETRVLFVTGERDTHTVRKALSSGADGCLLKSASSQNLLRAIRVVAGGGTFVDPAIVERCEVPAGLRGTLDGLTPREREVVRMIARGARTADIAAGLEISAGTVRKHRENVMRKLALSNAAEVAAFAVRAGLG